MKIVFKNLDKSFRTTVEAQIKAGNCIKTDCCFCPFTEDVGIHCEITDLINRFKIDQSRIKKEYI